MPQYYVEYALSFGVESFENLWKIQVLHPHDAGARMQAWVPLNASDPDIGEEKDGIRIAQPGPRLAEVMKWMDEQIARYPYYWPKEGTYVDKFGYDFQVEIDGNNQIQEIELTQIAYHILKNEWDIQPPAGANPTVDASYETVEGGGVLVKLIITMDYSKPVSELSLVPFTKYPMQLVSLMYEEDTDTFHPKKEIILTDVKSTSSISNTSTIHTTQSMRFQFPAVLAKRFTLILRQQNPEKNTYMVHPDSLEKKDIWDKISKREAEVTLDATDGLETVASTELNTMTGWDVYLEALKDYQYEHRRWTRQMVEFKIYHREWKRAYESRRSIIPGTPEFREAFNAAREKQEAATKRYQTDILSYNRANTQYQKDLALYNKYLRDYAAWESKWGGKTK